MPAEELNQAAERIERFKRLGGVELSRLEPEQKQGLVFAIRGGTADYKRAIFRFRCPLCGNTATNNQDMEPMCTGPSWTDDHPPEVMQRITS